MHPAAATTASSTPPTRLPAHMGDACWLMSTQGPSFIKAEQVSFDLLARISNQTSPLPSPASVHKLCVVFKEGGGGALNRWYHCWWHPGGFQLFRLAVLFCCPGIADTTSGPMTPAPHHHHRPLAAAFLCPPPPPKNTHIPAISCPQATTPHEEFTDLCKASGDRRAFETGWYLLVAAARRPHVSRQQRIRVDLWTLAGAPGVKAAAAGLHGAVRARRVRAGMSHPPAVCVHTLGWQAVSQHTRKHQSEVRVHSWEKKPKNSFRTHNHKMYTLGVHYLRRFQGAASSVAFRTRGERTWLSTAAATLNYLQYLVLYCCSFTSSFETNTHTRVKLCMAKQHTCFTTANSQKWQQVFVFAQVKSIQTYIRGEFDLLHERFDLSWV